MKYLLVLLFFTPLAFSGHAQVQFVLDTSIPVIINNKTLRFPWAGGINAAQYNTMDLNGDGNADLVVFDRTSNKIYPFLNKNGTYEYAFDYSFQFPDDIKNWVLLRDFNCDGKKDIFTSHSFGIRVYINETTPGGALTWRPYVTGLDNQGNEQYYLKTKGFTSTINLQMNASDIPAIADVDGDTDLDIFVFRASGASTVEFHKNLSIENNGSCDSLKFERVTQTWGDFQECQCGTFAFNGATCPTAGGKEQHQGGKGLLLIDMDNDGDKDVVVSEETCSQMFFMENEGDKENAVINTATASFPNTEFPVTMPYFPVAYYEDVDFDGANDLVVSPNIASNETGAINFQWSSWLYRNTRTTQEPQFSFKQKDFLQDEMVDLGENAAPAFADYDNDGDQDMVVGDFSDIQFTFRGTLKLFENTGTTSDPSYRLVDDDYLQVSALDMVNLKPKFKDINGDNRPDLVFGGTGIFGFSTNIYYLLNQGNGKFSFDSNVNVLFSNLGQDENFEVADISGDGLVDLLIGKGTGRMEYYINTGDKNHPQFELKDDTFYGFDYSTSRLNMSMSVADVDGDGLQDLVVGDQRGSLAIYPGFLDYIDDPQAGNTDLVQASSGNGEAQAANLGGKLYPAVVNLFNEDKPALVLGTGQGGIQVLRNVNSKSGRENQLSIEIYPNPIITSEHKMLTVSSKIGGIATVISVLGQQVTESFFMQANIRYHLPVNSFKTGVYMILISSGDNIISQKFIVIE